MSLSVGICITTHNRRAELARTLDVLSRLRPPADEVYVVADGCTDGTVDFLRACDTRIHLLLHDRPRGSIPSRNELAAACACDVFVSLDDDSYPLDADFVGKVRALFLDNPQLAVAAFPQRTDENPETLSTCDFGPARFVGSYVNSGAAIRTGVFRELGGYPDFFFHAYEEPDFALRCVAAGWQVRYETSLIIRHHYSGQMRSELRTHHRHARNEFWSALMRCPAPQLLVVVAFRAARQFGYAWRRGLHWVAQEPKWWWAAITGAPQALAQRQPLLWARYRSWMELVRQPFSSSAAYSRIFGEPRPRR